METNLTLQECKDEFETETLDPRIKIELERLNKSCEEINKLENELEEAKAFLTNSEAHYKESLTYFETTLGSSINKARPYFYALKKTKILQDECIKHAQEFQKANGLYLAAKETLNVAETNLNSQAISAEWQEHLSETILKMNSSHREAETAEKVHRQTALEYELAEKELQILENKLQKHIIKTEVYFQESEDWNDQKIVENKRIAHLEEQINLKKCEYREAMNHLSLISEEIHIRRNLATMS